MSSNITKNIFWLTASRVAALVMLALAYFALFRYLKPFGSGQYQFVLSYVLLFSTVVDFGIQQFITKKIAENHGETTASTTAQIRSARQSAISVQGTPRSPSLCLRL